MSSMTRLTTTGSTLLALCALFAGCSTRTNVSVTGSTPTQFTHVYITAQAVWFNTAKGASADDSGWAKFQLKTPVTIDLVQQANGTLAQIASGLRIAPGTYNSILVLPVDPALDVTADALAINASANLEADYADASGTHTVPLVIPNPEKGIVIPGTLKVPVGTAKTTGVGIGVGSMANNNNANTTNNAQTLFGSPTTVNQQTTPTTSTTNNTTTVSFGLNFDANRDLHIFNLPAGSTTPTGVLLSSSATATDLSTTGGISGTLTLTNITNVATNPPIADAHSSRTAITASAETLSADGSHYVIVASAPVESGGTFTIYPLPSNSQNPTAYDLVIHGPNIETIIIKNVSVTTTTPQQTAAANTTGAVATTTASGSVSVGTLIPRTAFSYPVTLPSNIGANLPPGAALTFYQTIGKDPPHAVDEVGIDPVSHSLVVPETLGVGGVDTGTYGSNGGTITLTRSTPAESVGNYLVGATAPMYTDSAPSTGFIVKAPSSTTQATGASNSTDVQSIAAVPTLQPANAAGIGSISAAVTDTAGDTAGTLLVSHNGALIGSVDLGPALKTGGIGTVTVNGLPTGAVYYLSAILVSPSKGFHYESIATPVNLTAGSANATVALN
ncbi:MAG TPA: DUF4382 domain-containing protein [Steroidobacteraceae bacterium]